MLLLLRSYLNPWLLLVFILSLTYGYAQAYTGSQNDHPVTLNGNTTLRAVFKAIKQQTGFAVMYSTAATALNQDEKVNVNFKETPLDDVLAYVLRGKELEWKYSDDVLVIHKKEPAPEKKIDGDSTVIPAMLTGKITDADGVPLPGATVQVKGTTQGAVTDANGNFALARIPVGSTLIVSSLGYGRREVPVKGQKILMQLNVDVNKLDETEIKGYYTTTQRLTPGNVGVVKGKDIEKQPVSNPLLALQGRVPGLFITQNTGIAGGGVKVRIQGQNSINSGNDPLYIIDGVPINSQLPGTGLDGILGNSGETPLGAVPGTGNPLSYLNPADIESITVLKDADATAIYGSRAANGAILITTKRGKAGPVRFDLNLQKGWGHVTRKLKMLNTQQYLAMRHEAIRNDNVPILPTDYDINGTWDSTRYTDWQKELIGGTAQYTNINASVSGGTSVAQYLVGGTFHRETTVFPFPKDFADQKGSLHFNISSLSLNQKFRLQLTGNYMVDNNQLPSIDLTQSAIQTEPNAPALYNKEGDLNWAPNSTGSSTRDNPLTGLYIKYQNKTNNLISNLTLSYDILPGLEIGTSLGYTNMQTKDYSPTPLVSQRPEDRPYIERSAIYGSRSLNSWIIEPLLTYKKQIGKGMLESLLGSTLLQNTGSGESFIGYGYNSDQALPNILSAATIFPGSSFYTQYKYNALFGRINYNLQDRYVINVTARRDGSSRFGTANRFHTFGAVGAAWIFSGTNFILNNLPFLSFGKLRSSYGNTGNDQLTDYSFMSLYNVYFASNPYQGITSLRPAGLSNPYLKWEETKKLQMGIELGFIKDKLLFNATYSRNRSSNQLIPYTLPDITGFGNIIRNFPATVQNINWEFSVNTTDLKIGNIFWTSNVNLTLPQNKLIAFPDLATSPYTNSLIIGKPLNLTKAYHFLGVDPNTGLYRVADKDGKPTSTPDYLTAANVLINAFPKFYGGWQNTFIFKGIEIDFLLQFAKQIGANVLFNGNSALGPGVFISGASNQPIYVLDRWQKPGDVVQIQKYSTDFLGSLTQLSIARGSDAAYTDASYIRLKNLSISWQLPIQWKRVIHLQSCKVYVQGQNLLTFTKYKGIDPENQSTISLPPLRMLTAGIQVGL